MEMRPQKICPYIILKAPKGLAFFQSLWMSCGTLISPIAHLMPQQNWLLLMFEIGILGHLVASMKEIRGHYWSRQLRLCFSYSIIDRPKQILEKEIQKNRCQLGILALKGSEKIGYTQDLLQQSGLMHSFNCPFSCSIQVSHVD